MLINSLNFNSYISTNMLKYVHVLHFSTVFFQDGVFKQRLARNKQKWKIHSDVATKTVNPARDIWTGFTLFFQYLPLNLPSRAGQKKRFLKSKLAYMHQVMRLNKY